MPGGRIDNFLGALSIRNAVEIIHRLTAYDATHPPPGWRDSCRRRCHRPRHPDHSPRLWRPRQPFATRCHGQYHWPVPVTTTLPSIIPAMIHPPNRIISPPIGGKLTFTLYAPPVKMDSSNTSYRLMSVFSSPTIPLRKTKTQATKTTPMMIVTHEPKPAR